MSEWYFAYGSNLLIDQMVERTGPILQGKDRPRKTFLPNHRLTFNVPGHSAHVFANVLCPGTGVFGVLYSCSADALRRLDEFEQGYERRRVLVVPENGQSVEAFIYVSGLGSVVQGRLPSAEYLRRILAGARQHGLPEEYVREIEALAQNPQ